MTACSTNPLATPAEAGSVVGPSSVAAPPVTAQAVAALPGADGPSLRCRVVRGGAITAVAQGMRLALQLLSTAALARLLAPEAFGMVAMVQTVTAVLTLFKDGGISAAVVQEAEVSQDQLTALFWINAALGVAFAVSMFALAPAAAWFYGQADLVPLMCLMSLPFVVCGLGVQHQALLQRELRFKHIAVVDVGSMTIGLAAGVVMAWRGYGVYSFVGMQLASAFTTVGLLWTMHRWRPGLPGRGARVGSLVRFGRDLSLVNLINYLPRYSDNVLIGWFWGPGVLGVYANAYKLLLMPLQQLTRPMTTLAMPVLCRVRDDADRYRRAYQTALLPPLLMGLPLVVFTAVCADEVVWLLLGPKWGAVAPVFRWLAPASAISVFFVATGWVYQSTGQVARQVRWTVFSALVTVAAFAFAVRWGVVAVAAAYSVVTVLMRYPSVVYCFKTTTLKPTDLLAVLWRPATASAVAGFALAAVLATSLSAVGPLGRLGGGALVFGLIYGFGLLTLPGGLSEMRRLMELPKELRPAYRKAVPT